MTLLTNLNEVEPLVVVASLLLAVAVFIYSMATKTDVEPFSWYVRVLHFLARLCCIPIIVISAGAALIYASLPDYQWLPYVSFICIFAALLIIIVFWILVVPKLPDDPHSMDYLRVLYEGAQAQDVEDLKPSIPPAIE